MDTVTLLDTCYGIPQTMGFAMMFYRMDVLANLGLEVPESWGELLSALPVLQSNNMTIGVSYISALDFMIYQLGGNMWKCDYIVGISEDEQRLTMISVEDQSITCVYEATTIPEDVKQWAVTRALDVVPFL
jgi:hypothetical protein